MSDAVYGGREYRWKVDLQLSLSQKFDHPNKYSILKEWEDGDVDDFFSYWERENDDVLSIFWDKVMPQINAFHPSLSGEEESFSFYTKLIDADTGEEYKPATKARTSKLRKR